MPITATDEFSRYEPNLSDPATHAVAITPSDTDELVTACRGLYIGVAGTLKITTVAGDIVSFAHVIAGILPVRAKKVFATGTGATGIVALS